MDAGPSNLRKWNGGVNGAPCRPRRGERERESGRRATVQNTKICFRSSGTVLSSFDGKQDCGSPLSDPEVIYGGWRAEQWLSVNGSECQYQISTATEFLRCSKMGQMHQSVYSGFTFNNNDTSVD